MPYADFQRSSVFENEYERFCTELRAALKGSLSSQDDHFLKDGSEGRHKLVTVQRVRALALRSPLPEHHEMLAKIIGVRGATMGLVEATRMETLSTGPTDVAQYDFFLAPCKATGRALDRALDHQIGASLALRSSLHAHPAMMSA